MTSVSQRIEELRNKKGLSRPALAAALSLPKISIEKFETGRLTPNQEQIKKLAAFFAVSPEYLRGEASDPQANDNWLTGEVPDDEPVVIQPPKRKIVASSDNGGSESAPLTALLKSDSFRALVQETLLDILRSPEGQDIIASAIKKASRK